MSLAIKTQDGSLIYFDAVTSYRPSYNNTVTKHPVDGGGVISDHYVEDNPTFNISGIVSDSDFNYTDRPLLTQDTISDLGGGNIRFVNNNPVVTPVSVNSSLRDSLLDFQAILGRRVPQQTPSVNAGQPETSDDNETNILKQIKDRLKTLRNAAAQNDTNEALFSVVEFDGNNVIDVHDNCVLTQLSFPEDAQSGSALFVELQIEKITFVTLQTTTIPKDVQASMRDSASSTSNKGNQVNGSTDIEDANSNNPLLRRVEVLEEELRRRSQNNGS